MDTLQAEVKTALDLVSGVSVYYAWPASWESLPVITWREADNSESVRVDAAEYETRVEYYIDIWAATPESTASVALQVQTRLSALGLKRTFSTDLFEASDTGGIHHKTMRYGAKVSNEIIHQ